MTRGNDKPKSTNPKPPGVIERQVTYRLDTFLAVSGNGRKAYDAMLRRGLKVQRCGKRVYINGGDFIDFLATDSDRRQAAAV